MNVTLMVGKPNSGKSLLFNRLTGLQQKVANFPGVTVEIKRGTWQEMTLIDFPGTYTLNPLTKDESVAIEQLHQHLKMPEVKVILCVLDAINLEKSLVFGLQLLSLAQTHKKRVVFAVNMMDEVSLNNLHVDVEGLSKEIGIPVVPISAKNKSGLEYLYTIVNNGEQMDFAQRATVDPVVWAKTLSKKYGPQVDVIIKKTNRWDQIFLSTFWGGIIFFILMLVLFQSIFSWSVPLMDLVEDIMASIGRLAALVLPQGFMNDFFQDAIVGGLGAFLVFVPQIFVLTFIIGILEDSGYLARAALICHRPFKFFGLTGKSFIPFLSGHACAIPAIYATRMIESPKKRLITLLTVPLISCSARLPIYSLFIVALIPPTKVFGGFITLQGVCFFALFLLGYIIAFAMSALYSRWLYKKESDAPFIIEMPKYRRPLLKPLVRKSFRSSWNFLSEAGPIIFVVTVIVWVLGYFPNGPQHLNSSWLASMGHWMEPIVKPMGLDWRYGVAILSSFVAREVFVGTLGTFYGIEGAEDNVVGLAESVQNSGITLASGLALLVFYVIALQCVSTLAVIRRETGSLKIPVGVFLFYNLLGYVLALITYQVFS